MLLTALTPEQEKDSKNPSLPENHKGFNVRGSNGLIYRILVSDYTNNVLGRSSSETDYYRMFGCNPSDFYEAEDDSETMSPDRFIAQKIFLECDAPGFCRMSCADRPWDGVIATLLNVGDYGGKI